ncbi:hypothetical protein DPMN_155470 [Dreissena polymorpha]|uniref:Uncharacterized protein n=1 Tax=Dreissena polymorpha TaxID=45954 RepID=A0A9D4FR93_DREPO|nr:hypothetical protein DPMN_155470 [Dreissena polymorpha]
MMILINVLHNGYITFTPVVGSERTISMKASHPCYQQPVSYRCIATETLLSTSLIANTELNNIGHNLTYKRLAEQEEAIEDPLEPFGESAVRDLSRLLDVVAMSATAL